MKEPLSGRSQPFLVPIVVTAALLLVGTVTGMSLLLINKTVGEAPEKAGQAIQHVLDLDAHYFKDIRAKQQLWDPTDPHEVRALAKLGSVYHAKASTIDLSDCPASFQNAYQAHSANWAKVVQELKEAAAEQAARTFDSLDTRSALSSQVQEITRPLGKTWRAVGAAAKKSGVFVRNG